MPSIWAYYSQSKWPGHIADIGGAVPGIEYRGAGWILGQFFSVQSQVEGIGGLGRFLGHSYALNEQVTGISR